MNERLEINEIQIDKTLIYSQCPIDEELWIYLDVEKQSVQMYTNGPEEEVKVKYNFVKMALKYGFTSSSSQFWKRIKDVTIRAPKEFDNILIVRYEFE